MRGNMKKMRVCLHVGTPSFFVGRKQQKCGHPVEKHQSANGVVMGMVMGEVGKTPLKLPFEGRDENDLGCKHTLAWNILRDRFCDRL